MTESAIDFSPSGLSTSGSSIEFSQMPLSSAGFLQIEDDIITIENATAANINPDKYTYNVTNAEGSFIARVANISESSNALRSGNGNGKNGNGKNGNGKNGNGNGKNGNSTNGHSTTVTDDSEAEVYTWTGRGRGVFTYPYYKGGRTHHGHSTTTAGTRQYCAGGCKSLPGDFGPVCAVFLKEERQDTPVAKTGYKTFSNYCQMFAANCAHPGQVGGELEEISIFLPR